MAEFPCPHCKTPVHHRAKICAACGKRIKAVGIPGKLIMLSLGGVMLAVAVIAMIRGPAP
jgi:hypothetical protein